MAPYQKATNSTTTTSTSAATGEVDVSTSKMPIPEGDHHQPDANIEEDAENMHVNNDNQNSDKPDSSKLVNNNDDDGQKQQPVVGKKWGSGNHNAKELAGLYSKEKRAQETIGLGLCVLLILVDLYYLINYFDSSHAVYILFYALAGICTADFASGVVHWAADTWGTVEFPYLGPGLLRPFREHHIDPTSICRHDFIETNADCFTICTPFLGYSVYKFYTYNPDQIAATYKFEMYVFFLVCFVTMTNEFHKWSHTYFGLPKWITILQDYKLILPKIHHRQHHVSPHEVNYCITTGWLNPFLEAINFWRASEYVITKVTGAIPRSDDMKWSKMD